MYLWGDLAERQLLAIDFCFYAHRCRHASSSGCLAFRRVSAATSGGFVGSVALTCVWIYYFSWAASCVCPAREGGADVVERGPADLMPDVDADPTNMHVVAMERVSTQLDESW